MGAGQALHFGEQKAEVLGVDALLAFGDIAADGRAHQRRLVQRGIDDGIPVGAQARHIDADAGFDGRRFRRAVRPELLGIGEQVVERCLDAGVRLVGAVTEAYQPIARMAQVVADFLLRLGGDGGEVGIGRLFQGFPEQRHQGAVQEVADDGRAVVEIALGVAGERTVARQFKQRVVAELVRVAEVGQLVFRAVAALQRGDQLVEQAGLADQVEADVGQRDVLLEDGAVPAPLGIALAEDQGIVGEVQQVVGGGAHHMCPTSSGMS